MLLRLDSFHFRLQRKPHGKDTVAYPENGRNLIVNPDIDDASEHISKPCFIFLPVLHQVELGIYLSLCRVEI